MTARLLLTDAHGAQAALVRQPDAGGAMGHGAAPAAPAQDLAARVQACAQVFASRPTSPSAWCDFSAALLAAEQRAEALKALSVAAVLAATEDELRYVGDTAFQARAWAVARGAYQRLDLNHPANENVLPRHVEALWQGGAPAEAEALAGDLVARRPDSSDFRLALARAQQANNDATGAEAILLQAVADFPADARLRLALVRCRITADRLSDAREALLTTPAEAQTQADILLARAELDFASRELDAAVQGLQMLLALHPGHVEANLRLSEVALQLRDFAVARRAASEVVAANPSHPLARQLLAQAAVAQQDWRAAAWHLAAAIALEPGSFETASQLAELLLERGAADEATAVADHACELHPSRFQLHHDRFVAQALHGSLLNGVLAIGQSPLFVNRSRILKALLNIQRLSSGPAADMLLASVALSQWPETELGVQIIEQLRRGRAISAAMIWCEELNRRFADKLAPKQWLLMAQVARAAERAPEAMEWANRALARDNGIAAVREAARHPANAPRLLRQLGAAGEPRSAERQFIAINLLATAGDLDAAEAAVMGALRDYPGHADFLASAVEVALLRGHQDRALALSAMCTNFDGPTPPDRPDVLAIWIGIAFREGRGADVRRLLGDVARLAERLIADGWAGCTLCRGLLDTIARFETPEFAHALFVKAAERLPANLFIAERLVALALKCGEAARVRAAAESLVAYPTADRLLLGARVLDAVGERPAARALLRQAILSRPDRAEARDMLGDLGFEAQEDAETDRVLRAAMAEVPGRPATIVAWATQAFASGRLPAELALLERQIERFPADFFARLQFAVALGVSGDLGRADREFGKLLGDRRYSVDILEHHTLIRLLRMDFAGICQLIEASDLARDRSAAVLRRVSGLYRRIADPAQAARVLRRILRSNPQDASTLLLLAELLLEADEAAETEVEALLSQAAGLQPLNARVYMLRSALHQRAGRVDAARQDLDVALMLGSDPSAVQLQRGLLDEEAGDIEAALAAYWHGVERADRARRRISPRNFWHLVTCHMLRGEIAAASTAHARQCDAFDEAFPRHLPLWRGERLHGQRLLIGMRGGPGDEVRIATICFPKLLEAPGLRLTLACDPRLTTLLRRTFPEVTFIPVHSPHRRLRRAKADHELISRTWSTPSQRSLEMSMAYDQVAENDLVCHSDRVTQTVFFEGKLSAGTPLRQRSLVVDETRAAEMRAFLATLPAGLRVGLCWRGSYVNRYRQRGFLDAAQVAPLLGVAGAQFVNLQVALTDEERAVLGPRLVTHPSLDLFDDFEGTAALLAGLDLVISVGVTMRDLAGALGGPVWSITAFPGAADLWRRTPDGSDILQPSIRHYDLETHGDRTALVAAMVRDLGTLARERAAEAAP